MAKINHQNFVDTINDMLIEAKSRGIIHLAFDDSKWKGSSLKINQKELANFGTCGYLGLETHPEIISKSIEFTRAFGTQFSISRSYVTSQNNLLLEDYLSQIYQGQPVIAFTSTTMAHLSVLPIVVGYNDAIILDQQCHISIQTMAQLMGPKGVPIDIIRHSNMEMLENKIRQVYDKHERIWYMIDGVYSMYGDIAPMVEINQLLEKYPKLHLYVDDAHGMSWHGVNGCGRLYESCSINKKTIYISTMAKGFGTMGGIAVFPTKEWHGKVILHGGPLAYSHPIPPPMLGASIASAQIHLSPEIYELQSSLKQKIEYANLLFSKTNIPVLSNPETPIYFVGTGQPTVGYNLNKRIIDEGFYINIGMFPAVSVKNTGLRFTITNHNSMEQIKSFIEALVYHYPKALESESRTINDVRRAFRLPLVQEEKAATEPENLALNIFTSIKEIDKELWDNCFSDKGNFDWEALLTIENSFKGNELLEENWKFYYVIITDEQGTVVLASFFTSGIFKDDMLSPLTVSQAIETKRNKEPYYLCSNTLTMGSLITEGEHLFLNREHPLSKKALTDMLNKMSAIQDKEGINSFVLRDFDEADTLVADVVHCEGFFKMNMPNSNVVDISNFKNQEEFIATLSAENKRKYKKEVKKYSDAFQVEILGHGAKHDIEEYYNLYGQVKSKNLAINIFSYPKKLIENITSSPNWETVCLYTNSETNKKLIAVCFCYVTPNTYCPIFLGMDYDASTPLKGYKQMLYQLVSRAISLRKKTIYLGLSADTDKKKVGAVQIKKAAYVSIKDSYNLEVMNTMEMNHL